MDPKSGQKSEWTVPAFCQDLFVKLQKIGRTFCNSSLDEMMASWVVYEVVCSLEKASELGTRVYLWSDVTPDIKDKLGLPMIDTGIDFIDEKLTFAGQAKYYQEGSYVKAEDTERARFCMYRSRCYSKEDIMTSGCEITTPEGVRLSKCRVCMEDVVHKIVS